MPYNLVDWYQCYGGTCCFQGEKIVAAMLGALVPIYQTVWRHFSEDYNLTSHSCENLHTHKRPMLNMSSKLQITSHKGS
jgi:hypothetical protein